MSYKTAAKETTAEFVERRSRFLGHIKPAVTEQEAIAFIQSKRQKYWDATHNVYAYILREGIQRFSDDGEPHGTAGMPVLQVLQKEGLTDVVLVVTRYFGGILLGAGGLVRAYSKAAKLAVDAAGIALMRMCRVAKVACDYGFYSTVLRELENSNAVVEDTIYGANVEITFIIRHEDFEAFNKRLSDVSAGAYKAEAIGEKYAAIG